ncbi:MAG: F-box protein [Candidatus Electrothrix sp. LOE1_4_5]|nr:F-box protein [Candidatus Electrothrix gigas]
MLLLLIPCLPWMRLHILILDQMTRLWWQRWRRQKESTTCRQSITLKCRRHCKRERRERIHLPRKCQVYLLREALVLCFLMQTMIVTPKVMKTMCLLQGREPRRQPNHHLVSRELFVPMVRVKKLNSNMTLLLTALPTELLQKVLLYASSDTKTLLNCETTCHALKRVVCDDNTWHCVPVIRTLDPCRDDSSAHFRHYPASSTIFFKVSSRICLYA